MVFCTSDFSNWGNYQLIVGAPFCGILILKRNICLNTPAVSSINLESLVSCTLSPVGLSIDIKSTNVCQSRAVGGEWSSRSEDLRLRLIPRLR